MHGREPQLPLGCRFRAEDPDGGREEFARRLEQKISEAYSQAREKNTHTREARAKTYGKGKKQRSFKLGEKVYLHEPAVPPGHARKFRRPWTGPHTVIAQTSPVDYGIALTSGGNSVVHINRLKPAFEKVAPGTRDQGANRGEIERDRGNSGSEESSLSEDEQVGAGENDTTTESEQESEPSQGSGDELSDSSWTPQEGDWDQTEASRVPHGSYELRRQTRNRGTRGTPEGPDSMLQTTPVRPLGPGVNVRPRRRRGRPGTAESS